MLASAQEEGGAASNQEILSESQAIELDSAQEGQRRKGSITAARSFIGDPPGTFSAEFGLVAFAALRRD